MITAATRIQPTASQIFQCLLTEFLVFGNHVLARSPGGKSFGVYGRGLAVYGGGDDCGGGEGSGRSGSGGELSLAWSSRWRIAARSSSIPAPVDGMLC